MSVPAPHRFSWKPFVSFLIVLTFSVIAISGLVLYVAPPGRVANWSHWTLVALDKAAWQSLHTIFATLFLVAAGFHLFFNWKVLMAYLKSKLHAGVRMKRELAVASALVGSILVLTLAGAPPFETIMTAGDDLKNSWVPVESEPPIPHAEELTLARFAETTKLPLEKIQATLQRGGLEVGEAQWTLGRIAATNGLTPQQLYARMRDNLGPARPAIGEGGGYGRRTVRQIAEQHGVELDAGLARLRAQGIAATADANVRELADASGRSPVDLVKIFAGESAGQE
jgi:hypothetical protein